MHLCHQVAYHSKSRQLSQGSGPVRPLVQPATLANRAQLHSSASCLCAVAGVHLGSCAAGGWCSCWQLIDSSLPDIQDGACSWGCHLHNFFVIQTLEVDRTPCFSVSPAGCVIGLQFWFLFTSRASEISETFHVSDTVVPQIIAGFDRVLGPGLKEILSKIFVSTYLISYIGCRSSIQHVKKQ